MPSLLQIFKAISERFNALPMSRKAAIVAVCAAVIAVLIALAFWAQQPAQRTLFSQLSDKDSGEIIAALQAMNVPYSVGPGNVIEVPANLVYSTRLQLATQGLPKGGNTGFELLEGQRIGISQFAEQVTYQRAVEGELGRTIQSMDAIDSARVHLALPKPTVFVREQQKPSASVLLQLRGGRHLSEGQVTAIMHLVASSVPELPFNQVTVVDDKGNLLSQEAVQSSANGTLNRKQLEYAQTVEQGYAKRIEDILSPIWGKENIKAQVTAALDFSQSEQTSEVYKPNEQPASATVRSRQIAEAMSDTSAGPTGVPGALSNQPPGAATAPIVSASPPAMTLGTNNVPFASNKRSSTTNYEVDKMVSHIRLPVGLVKRLSVAVVVNYKKRTLAGKTRLQPLAAHEITQIRDLAREAMGLNEVRGDTLNVVNAPFASARQLPTVASWRERAEDLLAAHAFELIKYLIASAVILYLCFGVLRPVLRDLAGGRALSFSAAGPGSFADEGRSGSAMSSSTLSAAPAPVMDEAALRKQAYAEHIVAIKKLAKEDPHLAATIIRDWMARGDK